MSLVYRQITGRFLTPELSASRGYLEFTPTSSLTSAGDGAIIPLSTVSMYIDSDGYISGELACNDSPDVSPTGWLWQVEEKIKNGEVWWMEVPTGDLSTYDIVASKVPGLAPPGYQVQGTPGPPGEDGVTDHGLLSGLLDDDHTQYALVVVSAVKPVDPRVGTIWVTDS